MKELGFDGSTLENLVAGVAPKPAATPAPEPQPAMPMVTVERIDEEKPD